jgi:hypothetical protein
MLPVGKAGKGSGKGHERVKPGILDFNCGTVKKAAQYQQTFNLEFAIAKEGSPTFSVDCAAFLRLRQSLHPAMTRPAK